MCVVYKNVVETHIYINRGNWQQNEIYEQLITDCHDSIDLLWLVN